jgi:hypothetical protein
MVYVKRGSIMSPFAEEYRASFANLCGCVATLTSAPLISGFALH